MKVSVPGSSILNLKFDIAIALGFRKRGWREKDDVSCLLRQENDRNRLVLAMSTSPNKLKQADKQNVFK